jgi:hypothetical protein
MVENVIINSEFSKRRQIDECTRFVTNISKVRGESLPQ